MGMFGRGRVDESDVVQDGGGGPVAEQFGDRGPDPWVSAGVRGSWSFPGRVPAHHESRWAVDATAGAAAILKSGFWSAMDRTGLGR